MSSLTKFRTPPIPNADEAFKFIVYGDMGISPPPRAATTAQYCINEIEKNNATFVVHLGDISYALGHVSTVFKEAKKCFLPSHTLMIMIWKNI